MLNLLKKNNIKSFLREAFFIPIFSFISILSSCSQLQTADSNRLPAEEFNCLQSFSALISQTDDEADRNILRPNWVREKGISKDYQEILIEWKAASSTANSKAEILASEQLQKIGMKPYIREVTPDSLPKPKFMSELALLNPKLKDYIEKLNESGYKLIIDPPMGVQSDTQTIRGVFSPGRFSIRILPTTTWDVFMHEYQHFVFHKLGLRNQNFSFVPKTLSSSDEKIISVAKKMYELGYSSLAVDETMAVAQEIKTLHKMGYTPWSGPVYEARKYAWDFQLDDIEKKGANDGKALAIKAKIFLLHPVTLRLSLLSSAGTIYLYREDFEEILSISPDGSAEKFVIEKDKVKNK